MEDVPEIAHRTEVTQNFSSNSNGLRFCEIRVLGSRGPDSRCIGDEPSSGASYTHEQDADHVAQPRSAIRAIIIFQDLGKRVTPHFMAGSSCRRTSSRAW